MQDFYVTKADGTSEVFREEKLIASLRRAGATEDIANNILTEVLERFPSGVSTTEIYKTAFRELRRHNRPIAARYSLRRALFDLGPSGFPFEDFVAALFTKMGYKTKLRQTVQGKCVLHEVDVLASNGEECVAIEVKFHNSAGFKTNVKTMLYVHARSQDIFAKHPDKASCPIQRALLVTNTKFTYNAIQYADCVGFDILGWRHPEEKSLLDLMMEYHVYPITALTTLSKSQKDTLIEEGIILCEELPRRKEVLVSLGLSKEHVSNVLEEASGLCTMPYEAEAA